MGESHVPWTRTLALRIALAGAVPLLAAVGILSWGSVWYQQSHLYDELAIGADRLSNSIRLGARYAMMTNAREEINHIIRDISGQKHIAAIRIYNKEGVIKFSGRPEEVEQRTNIRDEACRGCHESSPPRAELALQERVRVFTTPDGDQFLGSLSPIYNEPGCSGPPCHFHAPDKVVLGALDVVLPLEEARAEIFNFQRRIIMLAAAVFILGAAGIALLLRRFLTRPVRLLIEGTRRIARGERVELVAVRQQDEVGELARSISRMSRDISDKQVELNRQRDEYQHLFDQVPCTITVQDKSLRLLKYNREFRERFNPTPGEFCFKAYKGRLEKCPNCAVERTMETGLAHCSEESAINADGTRSHWIVHTSPVLDARNNVVAAMEMCLDITARKELEERLRRSELKYHAIFHNIPNAVFVLDEVTLAIIDCNGTAESVYGWSAEELKKMNFLDMFVPEERDRYASQLKAFTVLNRARHVARGGRFFFVDIMLSPTEYNGRQVLLLTTSDITERLEAEQKVIQAGKMATLGEMATGMAHELNQPLTVIKAASSFMLRKVRRNDAIAPDVLSTLATEVDAHVDRASRIIEHMREFGRKPDLVLERVDVNSVLRAATEFFSRQMAVRGIAIEWELAETLPIVMAEANRLEQVLINLLVNARDAIEEHCAVAPSARRVIGLSTSSDGRSVRIDVRDTGAGVPRMLQGRIFEPFFTTKKVGKGTGLGLSISYGLIKDFGGSISVEDAPGGGALFIVRLPAAGAVV